MQLAMFTSDIPFTVVVALALSSAWLLQKFFSGVSNVFSHPLAAFPGPKVAAITAWYKTYQEVFLGRSWIDVLQELHGKYGMRCLSSDAVSNYRVADSK